MYFNNLHILWFVLIAAIGLVVGKVVAFVKGNRNVNRKNIRSKKRTLKDYHGNMTPLLYVDGIKAVTDGCTLCHPENVNKVIPNSEAEKCIVILDGQHRYLAALESKLDLNNLEHIVA